MDSSDGEDAMSEPCSDTDQEIAEDSGTAQLIAPTVSSLRTFPPYPLLAHQPTLSPYLSIRIHEHNTLP